MLTLLRGGVVIHSGYTGPKGFVDILIEDQIIAKILPLGEFSELNTIPEENIIDITGLKVVPGMIDMHVHFREPGFEYKETISSGCAAAVSGGFTDVCTMPNTDPANDSSQVTSFILKRAAEQNAAKIHPVGAISVGLKGLELAEFGDLKASGIVGVTDDGNPVMNSQLMRRAMEYARGFDLLVISHCEELNLSGAGVMNEGEVATQMGLRGIPNASESTMVMRDIELSRITGSRLHIAHVSTKESVDAIRKAKDNGIPVTAETAPHYFALTDEAVRRYNTNAKMNPPLRTEQDRQAIRQGLADGTIDVIATDHAPHSVMEKEVEFDKAANGIIGLESSLPISFSLVGEGVLSTQQLVEKMATNPGRILKLEKRIAIGAPADLTVIDFDTEYRIDVSKFKSKSRNCPFHDWQVRGRAALTIVDGNIVFDGLNRG
jgi:dihydroorotase